MALPHEGPGHTVSRVRISNDAAAVRMAINELREELVNELLLTRRLHVRQAELLEKLLELAEQQEA